ncbi:MAG: caspase family protein [Bryobacteraceae bacterium]|nr:caspase family protein [Solibacteraceae bacterium]MCO5351057.1 caspase family protein [Bryobacteraceae bacterium]
MRKFTAFLLLAAAALAQTPAPPPVQPPKQQRDLKFESEVARPPAAADPQPVTIPRSYALIIGVANYQNLPANAQLQYSERDAESIYSILISPEGGNFRAENVHKLVGDRATLANIRHELESWLPSVTKDDDRVLIYFAGHGFVHQGRGYLAPYDIHPDRIQTTGYPMDALGQAIGSKINGKWKVLLTDSCHSGAITPADDAAFLNKTLLDLNRNLFSLTASRDRERSFESAEWGGGHGIFTYYVVKGLEGLADENADGIVTADELAEYVRRNVREATGGQQNPTSDRGSFDANMLLSYLPSGVTPGAPPAPKFGTLVIEANMDGVEVFVNGKSAGVVNKSAPLRLPGLPPGVVTVRGVKMGYEPDGPREEMVYPGQESTISIKIMIPRRRPRAAVDKFDDAIDQYNRGGQDAYKRAAALFEQAFQIDPTYSQAALYLGRSYDALYDQETASKWFQKAIEIDPDYLEARASFGGMLLGMGSVDEAIRQFNIVTQRDKKHPLAWYLQAQAYRMKEMYRESIDSARRAIQIAPQNAEARFWLAESLRMSGKPAEATPEYLNYLRLSDFDSKLAGKLNYYVGGFLIGYGRKKRAAQRDIWKDLRSLAYFGLCENSKNLKQYQDAIAYCRQAINYDPEDAFAHYLLGLNYAYQAQAAGSLEMLAAAKRSFQQMLDLNPDLAEADFARKNLASIDNALRSAQ